MSRRTIKCVWFDQEALVEAYRSTRTSWRNTLAHALANAALSIATRKYRDMIAGAIEYGLRSAARDASEGLPSPPELPIALRTRR